MNRAARCKLVTRLVCLIVLSGASAASAQVYLTADGVTTAETRVKDVLHASPETPDCAHPIFGPHITEVPDPVLGTYVFDFNMHMVPDNDRCEKFDRQRLEIKTEGNHSTPAYLYASYGETVTYRWIFELPAGFQPSYSFTHIHQIKAYNGDDGAPIITLTPRYGHPDAIQLINVDSHGHTTYLAQTPMAPFLGTWVEAYEKITYSNNGQYSIVLRKLSDGSTLFSYSNSDLDLWRNGTTAVRPKWGIYRSLNHPEQLRNEQVRFGGFCLAKGTDDCPATHPLQDFSITPQLTVTSTTPGGAVSYTLNVSPVDNFSEDVNLLLTGSNAVPGSTGTPAASNLTGLPAAATASFSQAKISAGSGSSVLTITTSHQTPPGNYTLVVSGISADGVNSHVVMLPLVVEGTVGDVDGNGSVGCDDLEAVRTALGAKIGDSTYNPLADFNGDGFVDVRDLAFVSSRITNGKCQ